MRATVLSPGTASGELLVLDEPLSFWGGFDPVSGKILDASHPQAGVAVTGKILAMERARGSAGTPAGVAESLRNGSGPIAVVLVVPEVNLAVGAQVAAALYGVEAPVVTVTADAFAELRTGEVMSISAEGEISVGRRAREEE